MYICEYIVCIQSADVAIPNGTAAAWQCMHAIHNVWTMWIQKLDGHALYYQRYSYMTNEY